MIERLFSEKLIGIPACAYDPYFSERGYLENHPREYDADPPYMKITKNPFNCYYEHMHRELEVQYIVCGKYYVNINGHEREIGAGDMLIVNPFDAHRAYYRYTDGPLYYYFTILDLAFFAQSMPDQTAGILRDVNNGIRRFRECVSQTELDALAGTHSEPIEEVFRALHDDFTDRSSLRMVTDVYRLLALLLPYALEDESQSNPNKDFTFICSVNEIVEQYFTTAITTAAISEMLNYSESHFCRRFRACFGMTFSDYLCHFRLRRAAEFSFTEKHPLTEIAEKVGFNDYAYFSRSFRQYFGMTPTQYFQQNNG